MKPTLSVRFTLAFVLVCCLTLASARAENTAAVDEVLKLKNAGVSEDVIVSFIQGKNINYELSADSILALRDKGISSSVLNTMLASGSGSASAVAAQPVQPAPQPSAPVSVAQPPTATPPVAVTAGVSPQPMVNPDTAYFYQELSPYGRWILTEDGQSCWQPTIVTTSPGWRPYWDKGRWVWSDHGWYWTSDYSWGWAAFHYGRWDLHPHHGWVWFPDRVWGPAWVTWRSGGEYCGWAPLPRGVVYDLAGSRFLYRGRVVAADFDFGLGFAHFNFCFRNEMGEPLRQHFRNEPERHAVFIRTTVVNHYSVNRVVVGGETHSQVFNHGIEPRRDEGRGRSSEPVRIQEMNTPAPGRAHEHMDSRNRTLEVYRPKFGGHH